MAAENPIWGEARIADELRLRLGLRVPPRTVGKYLTSGRGRKRTPDPKQRWATFVRNHATRIVACDFFVVVAAAFRVLYVFVVVEVGTPRIVDHNVTDYPTADWTLRQFREALPGVSPRERDQKIQAFSASSPHQSFAETIRLRTSHRCAEHSPAHAFQSPVQFLRVDPITVMNQVSIGVILRRILRESVFHYNHGRPNKSLGPGIPAPYTATSACFSYRHALLVITESSPSRSSAVSITLRHRSRVRTRW